MDKDTKRKKEYDFMNKHVFYGLTDLNDGFDTFLIQYFSAADFEIVLQRVKAIGLGIYGIEPWLDGHFYDVTTCPNDDGSTDAAWYFGTFEKFKAEGKNLQYAASYYVPDEYLMEESN